MENPAQAPAASTLARRFNIQNFTYSSAADVRSTSKREAGRAYVKQEGLTGYAYLWISEYDENGRFLDAQGFATE